MSKGRNTFFCKKQVLQINHMVVYQPYRVAADFKVAAFGHTY